jgi:hypothetical protein
MESFLGKGSSAGAISESAAGTDVIRVVFRRCLLAKSIESISSSDIIERAGPDGDSGAKIWNRGSAT